jgi:hypothetical protein
LDRSDTSEAAAPYNAEVRAEQNTIESEAETSDYDEPASGSSYD